MTNTDELELVERVFLRIATADTDEKLENSLAKFLPPILLKLSSPQEPVRAKVMELLSHINKRIKSRPMIQLPVETLLGQYEDPHATTFLLNFALVYLKIGFPRLPLDKQSSLVPTLLRSIEGKITAHQHQIIYLCIPVLNQMTFSSQPDDNKDRFELQPKSSKAILSYFLNFLLIPYNFEEEYSAPPGLSKNIWKELPQELPGEHLEKCKQGIIKFITSGIFSENDIAILLIVSSADTRHSVANLADMELKRVSSSINWNNKSLTTKIYEVFLGSEVAQKNSSKSIDDKKLSSDIKIRLKLFPCLLRSKEASTQIPFCIQVVFEGLFGYQSNPKIKTMSLQFTHSICNNCEQEKLALVGQVLFNGFLKVINEYSEIAELVRLAYVGLGFLALKLPQLLTKNITVLQMLFQNLEQESPETRVSIQECLSLFAKALGSQTDLEIRPYLEQLILTSIDKPISSVRQMGVYYSETVFPRDHIPSKYVLILAAGDNIEEIRNQALKALHNPETKLKDPNFPELCDYLYKKLEEKSHPQSALPLKQESYVEMLKYLRKCLIQQSKVPENLLLGPPHVDQAPYLIKHVQSLIANAKTKDSVFWYLELLNKLLAVHSDSTCTHLVVELVCGFPELMSEACFPYLNRYKTMMISSKEDIRDTAAQLVANILFQTNHPDELADMLLEYPHKILETQHGWLILMGHMTSFYLNHPQTPGWLQASISLIYSELNNSHVLISSAACFAIGEIAKKGLLPKDIREEALEKLITIASKNKEAGKDPKRERAIVALGNICVGDASRTYNTLIIDKLLTNLKEIADIDCQFSVADSLLAGVLGQASPTSRNKWTTTENSFKAEVDLDFSNQQLSNLLKQIASSYINDHKAAIRQAAAIWLLTILKNCSRLDALKGALSIVQQAFLNLLADPNEIIQDMASKGLGILYEIGDETQKKQLVDILVETLTSGRRSNVTVTTDSKIFEDGMLGKSPTGGSLTTYKELCSLATDLNQPDLVYKFMHLANHHSIWNSRKGAAFGFGSIAAQAKDQLAPYMSQIVPKMYRYQFDPNLGIRESFSSIWNAVVPDPQKAADVYLNPIMEDLLSNLTSSQWRVRESSCLALKELLRGRNIGEIKDYLDRLWDLLFKVRDDIKESVRNAANGALTTLSKLCIKYCDAGTGSKAGVEALGIVIQCQVKYGLQSPLKEVKELGLETLIQISKRAGPMLKPHLPVLVVALLEALSTTEPQVISYLAVRQDNKEAQELLDTARINAYKSSPMMETLVHCVQYLDQEVLVELVPHLTDTLKNAITLGTKAGVSQFVIQLATHCPHDIQPYSGKFLQLFFNGLTDRNIAVRKSYAAALGHLIKVSKDSSVEKLLTKLETWYFTKEDMRLTCGFTLQSLARHSPDKIKDHGAKALPLAFFAMNTPDKKTNEHVPWEEVWLEFTPGTESGVQLYLSELLSLCGRGLEDQSWAMKCQAACTLTALADKLGTKLPKEQCLLVLDKLVQSLSGRIWDGKETILEALTKLLVECLPKTAENLDSLNQVVELYLRESKKEKLVYKQKAISGIGEVLQAHKLTHFPELFVVLRPMLESEGKDNKDDDEEEMNVSKRLELQNICLQSLGNAWPSNQTIQDNHLQTWIEVLSKSFNTGTWQLQLAVLEALLKTLSRLVVNSSDPSYPHFMGYGEQIVGLISKGLTNKKYTALRLKSLECGDKLFALLKEENRVDVAQGLYSGLKEALDTGKDDPSPQVRDRATKLYLLCKQILPNI